MEGTVAGSDKVMSNVSGRILFIFLFATTLLLTAYYTSWLYSMLAVKRNSLPFASLRAILDDGSYNFGVVTGWAVHTEIMVR